MVTINDAPVYAEEFAFDGCHKIYLINSPSEREEFEGLGYDFFPITQLKEAFDNSCPLRFISNADLEHSPVEQGQSAEIKEI